MITTTTPMMTPSGMPMMCTLESMPKGPPEPAGNAPNIIITTLMSEKTR